MSLVRVVLGFGFVVSTAFGAPGVPSGSAVRLHVTPAAPGDDLELRVSSPYREAEATVFVLSPSYNEFAVATGLTDESGALSVSLGLLELPGLAGENLSFHAAVTTPQGSQSSPQVHVRIPSEDGSSNRTEFVLDDEIIPPLPNVSVDWAELADIDGDGDLEALLAGVRVEGDADVESVPYIRVFENNGDGQFTETTETAIPASDQRSTNRLFVADLTNDGFPDFVATPTLGDAALLDSSAWLYVNDGNGGFSRDVAFPEKAISGHAPFTVAFGDVDSDGDTDVFIGNRHGGAHSDETPEPQQNELLLNEGGSFSHDAGFLEDDELNPLSLTRVAAFGDANGDGLADLFVGNGGGNQLLLNVGDGAFEDATFGLPPAAESTWGVEFADVDGDTDYDIVLSNTAFNPFAQAVLINTGGVQGGVIGEFEAGFFPPPAEGQALIRLGLQVADVTADGNPDLLFPIHELGAGEKPDLYVNQGGFFQLDDDFEASRGVYSTMAAGDLDGDGDLDLLVPKSGTFGEGDTVLVYALFNQTFASDNAPMAWLRGDANSDRVLDLSDAIFLLNARFLGGEQPLCQAALDANGDGAVDVTDAVFFLNNRFQSGPMLAAPFPAYGNSDETLGLSCDEVRIFE